MRILKNALKNVLVLSLCMQLSGVAPAVTAMIREAHAGDEGESSIPSPTSGADVTALSAAGDTLQEKLESMVRAARFPGTPGTEPMPTVADVRSVEAEVLRFRADLLRFLALPNSPASIDDKGYLPIDTKLRAINFYFNQVTSVISLRIALTMDHGASWRARLALAIPKSVMRDFPGLGADASNRLGDRFMPMTIDSSADPVKLDLSESLVQGLEVGRLADQPNDTTFFTMIQYLGTRQLLQNLAEIRYLKADRNVRVPAIPAALQAKLQTMGLATTILDEQHRAVAEPSARRAILAAYSTAARQIPAFVSAELIGQLAVIIASNAPSASSSRRARAAAVEKMRADLITPLTTVLTEAETQTIDAALDGEITASSQALASAPEADLVPSLKFFVVNAKASTLLNKFLMLMSEGTLTLSIEQRTRIMDVLEARKKALSDSLTDGQMAAWIRDARSRSEADLYSNHRIQFIETLLYKSREVSEKVRESFAGESVQPSTLSRSFAEELYKLAPRVSVQAALREITREGTYIAARDKYSEVLGKLAGPTVLREGMVIPELALLMIEQDKLPKPKLKFSDKINPAIRAQIESRVIEGRKRDIRNLVSIGNWMGFNRAFPLSAPTVAEVLPDADKRTRYYKTLKEEILSNYRILGTQVSHNASTMRLFDALVAISPNAQSSEAILRRAEPLVDEALIRTEENIIRNIRTIGEARELKEIEKIVEGSMMLELVMTAYPEFRGQQERFLESLLDPSLTHQIMNRYVGKYLTYGFGALFLLHIAKKVFKKRLGPAIDILMLGIEPLVKGYMSSALVLMLADTAYQAYEVNESRKKKNMVNDFFSSSAFGPSFFDYGELQATNTAWAWTKWMFIGRLGMDVVLMYIPMLKGAITKLGTRLTMREFARDIDAFQSLGLRPGEWNRLEEGLRLAREHGDIIGAEAVAQAERAYLRLSAKVRTGAIWDLEQIRAEAKPENMSPATKKLRKILNPDPKPDPKPERKPEK